MNNIPENVHDIVKAESNLKAAVFGEERLSELSYNFAGQETTTALLNMVGTLCSEAYISRPESALKHRWLNRTGEPNLHLTSNQSPVYDASQDEVTQGQAAIHKTHQARSYMKPKGMPIGLYKTEEGMFFDEQGNARIWKELSGIAVLGLRSRISSTKLATQAEVEDTIALVIDAVCQNDAIRTEFNDPDPR